MVVAIVVAGMVVAIAAAAMVVGVALRVGDLEIHSKGDT